MAKDRFTGELIAAYLFCALATLTTLLRLFSRVFCVRSIKWDDIYVVLSLLLFIAIIGMHQPTVDAIRRVIASQTVVNGERTFSPDFGPSSGKMRLYNWIDSVLYFTSIGFLKLSLLAFYLRFLPRKPYRLLLYASMAITIIFTVIVDFLIIFSWTPISGAWSWEGIGEMHVNILDVHVANSVFNVITDLLVLLLPIPTLLRLHIDNIRKYALLFIFALAGVGTSMTIVRLRALIKIRQLEDMVVPMVTRTARAIVWSEIEISVGILCANVPGLWALCRLRSKKRPSHQQRYGQRTASAGKATAQSRGVSYLDVEEGGGGSPLSSLRKGSAVSEAETIAASAGKAAAQSRGVSYLDIEEGGGNPLSSLRKGSAMSEAETIVASAAAETDIASLPIQFLDEEPAAAPPPLPPTITTLLSHE